MFSIISIAVIFVNLMAAVAYIPSTRFLTRLQKENEIVRIITALGLSTADFKNGMTMELEGVPFKLLEFLHVKPGKGSAFVRTKVKNLVSGTTQERTFRAGESIEAATIDKTEMQYTFTDGNNLVFMNMETFEEQRIDSKKLDNVLLMKEGLSCIVTIWNEQVIDVQLPPSVSYKVVETAPNFKGNTAQGAMKPATLDSGAIVNVPMFIEIGELITVSTEDCKYLGRDVAGNLSNK
eukprot:gene2799-5512_t